MISTKMKCKSFSTCKENAQLRNSHGYMSYRSLLQKYLFDWYSLEPFESLQINQEKPFAMLFGFLANNFSIVCIVEQYLNLVHETKIFGSYIGLYSTNLEIDSNSIVSAKGGGCAPNMG